MAGDWSELDRPSAGPISTPWELMGGPLRDGFACGDRTAATVLCLVFAAVAVARGVTGARCVRVGAEVGVVVGDGERLGRADGDGLADGGADREPDGEPDGEGDVGGPAIHGGDDIMDGATVAVVVATIASTDAPSTSFVAGAPRLGWPRRAADRQTPNRAPTMNLYGM